MIIGYMIFHYFEDKIIYQDYTSFSYLAAMFSLVRGVVVAKMLYIFIIMTS